MKRFVAIPKSITASTNLGDVLMTIEFGYKMTRREVEEYLADNNLSWDDFNSEDEAYIEAAEAKFDYGLGTYASFDDPTLLS